MTDRDQGKHPAVPRALLLATLALGGGACRYQGPGGPDTGGFGTGRPSPDDSGEPVADDACPVPVDDDGDGYVAPSGGGTDCGPTDAAVHPGAEDAAVDGADQDCDGVDGPPAPAACVPVGTETCDGVDEDCDGRVDDAFAVLAPTAGTVALVADLLEGGRPALVVGRAGATPADDGDVDVYDASGALVVTLAGTGLSPSFGSQIAAGRDLTGDGVADLAIAAPYAFENTGRVYVIPGPIGPTTTVADAVFTFVGGELAGQPGGQLAMAPDLDGDGLPELLVGYYRYALLFSGAPAGAWGVGDAVATWEWNTGGGAWHFAAVADEDGDGRPELALGMSTFSGGAGRVARYDSAGLGGAMGTASAVVDGAAGAGLGARLTVVDDALWTLSGTTPTRVSWDGSLETLDVVATDLADAGDLDGDGVADLVLETAEGLVAPDVGTWAGDGDLQTARDLAPARDATGDGVPDLALLGEGWTAALDGAVGFGGSCNADGDPYGVGEGDCDDADPAIFPVGAPDACDGVDNDCDGVVDAPAEAGLGWGALVVAGTGDGGLAAMDAEGAVHLYDAALAERTVLTGGLPGATALAGLGDEDGDGVAALVVAGADAAWVVPVGAGGDLGVVARDTLSGGTSWAATGAVGHAGDVDGDGLADAWVAGAHPTGELALAVFGGLEGGTRVLDDADRLWLAPSGWREIAVAPLAPGGDADLDGDGLDDLLVGNAVSYYGQGRAMVLSGGSAGAVDMDAAATLSLYGEPGEALGTALAVGGDWDGDGRADALAGGPAGTRVLIGGEGCPSVAAVRLPAAAAAALVDLDGDGRAEAWLGSPDEDWREEEAAGVLRVARPGEEATWRAGAEGAGLGALLWALGSGGAGDGGFVYAAGGDTVRVTATCE